MMLGIDFPFRQKTTHSGLLWIAYIKCQDFLHQFTFPALSNSLFKVNSVSYVFGPTIALKTFQEQFMWSISYEAFEIIDIRGTFI